MTIGKKINLNLKYMKKFMTLCCMAAVIAAAASCEKSEEGYTGTNYIYLTSTTNSMYDTADDALEVTVQLTTALAEDLTLTFKVPEDETGVITLEGNPLTVKAGEKVGKITVKTSEIDELEHNFVITLDTDATTLPANVAWKEDYKFTVSSAGIPDLTEAQTAIVEAYKAKTGIDLSKYLGLIEVTTVYTASSENEVPEAPKTIKTRSKILLSESATVDNPVLKMTVNPMGITDELYKKLVSITVNSVYWIDENAYPAYKQLMEAIDWTTSSTESFSVTLDGITLKEDKTIDFVTDFSYYDEDYEEDVPMFKVNFEYSFSAYEREKSALEAGIIGTAVDEYWPEDATANPQVWLNCDDISEDQYELGNYIESSASISEDAMVFTFPIYNQTDADYSKVVATYTPNK